MQTVLRRGALALLVALFGGLGCKDPGTHRPSSELILPAVVDFDLVALGASREQTLTLENASRFRLSIIRIVSRQAVVEVLDAEGFVLQPGERRDVRLRFTPDTESPYVGQLAVELEGGDVRTVRLEGRGVRSYVELHPAALDFGRVEVNTQHVLTLEAHNPTEFDAVLSLAFTGADADEFNSAETGREVRVGPGETHVVPIGFRPVRLGLAGAAASIRRCAACEPVDVPLRGEATSAMLEVFPTRLDFGRVALGATAEQKVSLHNNASEPVVIEGASIGLGEGPFLVRDRDFPRTLEPQATTTVTVAFSPPVTTLYTGELRLDVQMRSAETLRLALTGEGGSTCIMFLPRTLDFGTVPEGMSLTREVWALNRCTEDVTLSELTVRSTQGGFFGLSQAATSLVLQGGQKAPISVTFTPAPGGGSSQGQLVAQVQQGGSVGTETAALVGTSRVFAPCQYRVDPVALSFGRVPVGSEVTLGVAVTNVGTDECFVARMGLAAGSAPAFSTEPFQGGTLAPGARAFLTVHFRPEAAQTSIAQVEGLVNHPTQPYFTVPVSGEGLGSACFTLEPATVDFGQLQLSCGERQRQLVAYNRCTYPLTLTDLGLTAATSGDLHVVSAPTLPFVLPAGGRVPFTVGYSPSDEGGDAAALQVTSSEAGSLSAGLVGWGLLELTQTDRFIQELPDKVDVLFVVDNSNSMKEEQASLGQNFAAFMSAAQQQGADFHIGVTTTGIEPRPDSSPTCPGGVEGGEAGRLFPADNSSPRIITPSTPDAAAVFATNVSVGLCHDDEKGLEAAYRALSTPLVNSADDPSTLLVGDGNAGFLRPDARLALVFVSDEEDFSPQTVSFYETFFKGLKGSAPSMLSISAIVGPEDRASCPTASSTGTRYLALARATGGVIESICTSDWASSLERLSEATFPLKQRFPLSQLPADPAQVRVTIDGVEATSGWHYDASTNSVVFDAAAVPTAGSVVEVTYPLGC